MKQGCSEIKKIAIKSEFKAIIEENKSYPQIKESIWDDIEKFLRGLK